MKKLYTDFRFNLSFIRTLLRRSNVSISTLSLQHTYAVFGGSESIFSFSTRCISSSAISTALYFLYSFAMASDFVLHGVSTRNQHWRRTEGRKAGSIPVALVLEYLLKRISDHLRIGLVHRNVDAIADVVDQSTGVQFILPDA